MHCSSPSRTFRQPLSLSRSRRAEERGQNEARDYAPLMSGYKLASRGKSRPDEVLRRQRPPGLLYINSTRAQHEAATTSAELAASSAATASLLSNGGRDCPRRRLPRERDRERREHRLARTHGIIPTSPPPSLPFAYTHSRLSVLLVVLLLLLCISFVSLDARRRPPHCYRRPDS